MEIADITFSRCASIVSFMRQHIRPILLISAASCAASFVGASMLMEDLYRSEAEIRVLYGGGSGPIRQHSAERSVALVRNRITENSLEKIIVNNGLFPQVRST